MIASVFSKTRPFNYVIIGICLLLCYVLYSFSNQTITFSTKGMTLLFVEIVLLLISCALVNFISLKNTLTKNDNYAVLLFLIFLLFFPSVFKNKEILFSNFFLLLALRRLISLKSMIAPKEKLFDASFWILIAALFHFWSIVYIVLVFVSIILHVSRDFKNWLIPFIAAFAVAVLFLGANLLTDNFLWNHLSSQSFVSFEFSYFETIYQNIALAVFTSIAFLFFANQLLAIGSKPLNMQSSYKKIFFSFLLGVLIYVLSADKNNSCLAFSFAPLAIMGANFVESLETKLLKEITLITLVVFALVFFVSSL